MNQRYAHNSTLRPGKFKRPTFEEALRKRLEKSARESEKPEKLPKPSQIPLLCQECGKLFYAHPYRVRAGVKACSISCAGKLKRRPVKRSCANCGEVFITNPSQARLRDPKHCSRKCAFETKVRETAKKPVKDRYGRSGRKADRDWQKAVREKDDYTCQRCGVKEKYIHTHHVAPRGRRPDLKHEVSNGKCLCNSCHSWVHEHPIEAKAAGLLSGETYELARKKIHGEAHGMSKLTAEIVSDMRRRHAQGETGTAMALELGISKSTACRAIKGQGWAHVS